MFSCIGHFTSPFIKELVQIRLKRNNLADSSESYLETACLENRISWLQMMHIKLCLIRLLKSMHPKSLGTYMLKSSCFGRRPIKPILWSLNMILIDQQGTKIQATIKKSYSCI